MIMKHYEKSENMKFEGPRRFHTKYVSLGSKRSDGSSAYKKSDYANLKKMRVNLSIMEALITLLVIAKSRRITQRKNIMRLSSSKWWFL